MTFIHVLLQNKSVSQLADSLPSKTIPAGQKRASKVTGKTSKPKKRQRKDGAEDMAQVSAAAPAVAQSSAAHGIAAAPTATSSTSTKGSQTAKAKVS
jgi:hypothetical protein